MLSKNTSSSRAIPPLKMIESIEAEPFIPIAWQKTHGGMQGTEYFTDSNDIQREINEWLEDRDYAIMKAKNRIKRGVSKQIINRPLEPFMWTTMLITGSRSGWDNFFDLRCPVYERGGKSFKSWKEFALDSANGFTGSNGHEYMESFSLLERLKLNKGQAEIHIMDFAEKVYDAVHESEPIKLNAGDWHIPFNNVISTIVGSAKASDAPTLEAYNMLKVKISTAMAARTSYTIVGNEREINYLKMIELHDKLIVQEPLHASPMEHCAMAMSKTEYFSFFRGELDVRESYPISDLEEGHPDVGWCRNYKGFIQYRHILETKS